MRFELFVDKRGKWRWRSRARNGKITATGAEGYNRKRDCREAIEKHKDRAGIALVVEVKR